MKVIVTGASGLIGGAFTQRYGGDLDITGLNRSATTVVPSVQANIEDAEALAGVFDGVDVVIHLAARANDSYPWPEIRDTNVTGTFNVFNAATLAGVSRVVFASSGATVAGCEYDEPYRAIVEGRYDDVPADWPLIDESMPTRPRGVYGTSKVWGESMAQHLADTTATRFVSVRIGFVNAEDAPANPRQRAVWCSQRDVVQGLHLAATSTALPDHAVFFCNSDNRWGYRSLAQARRFGFEPQDGADR